MFKHLSILFLGRGTLSWNAETHEAIGRIASRQLRQRSLAKISNLLSEYDSAESALMGIAAWADTQEESNPYHFTHTPYRKCAPFDRTRDCENDKCLVTGIEKYWKQFVSLQTSDRDRIIALKYIVHFIADATQPLHTGFKEDAGGNGIVISDGKSLHEYWDWVLLERFTTKKRMNKDEFFESLIDGLSWSKISQLNIPPEVMLGSPYDIAAFLVTDTATRYTCNFAYTRAKDDFIETGQDLGDKYIASRQVAVLQQITKAGIRLGQIIDKMIDEYVTALNAANANVIQKPRVVSTGSESPNSQSSNIFEILFEFDPEEYLYDPLNLPEKPSTVKKVSHGKKRVSHAEEMKFLDDMIEAKNLKLFEGVDLSQLVLVKHMEQYFITTETRAALVYRNSLFRLSLKSINKAEPTVFHLDTFLTNGETPSESLVNAIFQTLKGGIGDIAQTDESTFEFSSVPDLIDILRAQLSPTILESVDKGGEFVIDVRKRNIENVKKYIRSNFLKFVVLDFGGLSLVSRPEWLLDPKMDKLIVQSCIFLGPKSDIYTSYLLVDSRLYDQPLDVGICRFFQSLSYKRALEIYKKNPKLYAGLSELNLVVLGQYPPNKPFNAIESFRANTNQSHDEFLEIVFKSDFIPSEDAVMRVRIK